MNKNNINVNIAFSTIIKTTLFFILLYLLFFFKDLAISVLTAIVLASALEPLIIKLEKKLKFPRIFATAAIYFVLLVAFISSLLLIIPPIVEQANALYEEVPIYLESLNNWVSLQTEQEGLISKIIEEFKNKIENISEVNSSVQSTDSLTEKIILLFNGLFNFILIIVLSFYFAAQQHGIEIFLKVITPAKYTKYAINLWKRSQKKIGLWMQGQLILGLLIGIITYLGLMVFFNLEQALLLAFMAIIAELIPIVGPFLVAIPAITIALLSGGWALAGGVAIFFLVIQMIENQLIYPLVVKKVVGVPSILVIISLIIGYQLFGFLGVLLSVPLAAAFMEFIKDIEKREEKEIETGKEKEINLAKN